MSNAAPTSAPAADERPDSTGGSMPTAFPALSASATATLATRSTAAIAAAPASHSSSIAAAAASRAELALRELPCVEPEPAEA